MKLLTSALRALLCAALLGAAGGCGAPADLPAPAPSDAGTASVWHAGRSYYGGASSEAKKYTQADYDLALSFRTEGYEAMSVADFNRRVMDWTDEAAFHTSEDAVRRLCWTLPEDDPNAGFIRTVLSHTWDECAVKHYNACARSQAPGHGGSAAYQRFGDIYGDKVLVAGGYAEYWFDYTLTDEDKLTVGEREAVFANIDAEMTAFLSGRTERELADEEAMEKTLLAQLNQILAALDKQRITTADSDLSYWWEEPYEGYYEDDDPLAGDPAATALEEGGQERDDRYTQEQYDALLKALQFQGWEQMSVAEFNRRLYAAFNDDGDEDWRKSTNYLYALVLSSLPDQDPNAAFLRETVPAGLSEYRAKAAEVYSGKARDPYYEGRASGYQEEDVFGDKVQTASTETAYRFTYRIHKPDQLTVAERDAFLNGVAQAARDSLKGAALTQADFKAALERAGKAAGNDKIQFTGCKINYFETWEAY